MRKELESRADEPVQLKYEEDRNKKNKPWPEDSRDIKFYEDVLVNIDQTWDEVGTPRYAWNAHIYTAAGEARRTDIEIHANYEFVESAPYAIDSPRFGYAAVNFRIVGWARIRGSRICRFSVDAIRTVDEWAFNIDEDEDNPHGYAIGEGGPFRASITVRRDLGREMGYDGQGTDPMPTPHDLSRHIQARVTIELHEPDTLLAMPPEDPARGPLDRDFNNPNSTPHPDGWGVKIPEMPSRILPQHVEIKRQTGTPKEGSAAIRELNRIQKQRKYCARFLGSGRFFLDYFTFSLAEEEHWAVQVIIDPFNLYVKKMYEPSKVPSFLPGRDKVPWVLGRDEDKLKSNVLMVEESQGDVEKFLEKVYQVEYCLSLYVAAMTKCQHHLKAKKSKNYKQFKELVKYILSIERLPSHDKVAKKAAEDKMEKSFLAVNNLKPDNETIMTIVIETVNAVTFLYHATW